MFTLEEKAVRPQAASLIRGPQVHNTGAHGVSIIGKLRLNQHSKSPGEI